MMKYLKPVIVLAAITTIISALLIVTYNLTYVDTSGIITESMNEKCVELVGGGEFRIVTDWQAEGFSCAKSPDVEKLILKNDGTVIFEVIESGYSKDGLDLLISMNSDGSVNGISVYKIGETPGLGTKTNDPVFLGKFSGKSEGLKVVKSAPAADNEIQAVTGATLSSKGITKAVNTAIKVYKEMGAVK